MIVKLEQPGDLAAREQVVALLHGARHRHEVVRSGEHPQRGRARGTYYVLAIDEGNTFSSSFIKE